MQAATRLLAAVYSSPQGNASVSAMLSALQETVSAGRELYFADYLVGTYLCSQLPQHMRIPLPAAVPADADDSANHMAVLLLGFGTGPAVQWAQQRLRAAMQLAGEEFDLSAALRMNIIAKMREWAFSSSSDFNGSSGMLIWRLGQVLSEAGLYEPALRLHIAARTQATRQHDNASKQIVARITSSMAALMIDQGDLEGALPHAAAAPTLLREAQAPADLIIEAGENYAVLLVLLAEADAALADGNLEKAAATFKQAAEDLQQAAAEARTSLETKYKAGTATGDKGKQEVLQLQSKLLGFENSELISRNNWGYVLTKQGCFPEAATKLKAAYDDAVRRLPPADRTTAIILDSMAFLEDKQQHMGESICLYQQALDMKTAVLGPQHPDTLATKQRLARVLLKHLFA